MPQLEITAVCHAKTAERIEVLFGETLGGPRHIAQETTTARV